METNKDFSVGIIDQTDEPESINSELQVTKDVCERAQEARQLPEPFIPQFAPKVVEFEIELPTVEKRDQKIIAVVDNMETDLVQGDDVIRSAANVVAKERTKADLAEEAARIHAQNMKTAETLFESQTRDLRLRQVRAKLETEHKYEMSIIKENGKHYAMLDSRKKMKEKYGYLYEKDENGEPLDFSYSRVVNAVRTTTRNFQRLDTTIKTVLKWGLIAGTIFGGYFLLRHFGIMN